jgi:hypothetical protein
VNRVRKSLPTTRFRIAGDEKAPKISRFLGIVVFMVYDDYRPPHFHAEYGEYKIIVEIKTGVVQGRFPRRALKAVME